MKAYLMITQVIFVAICIAIVAVNYTQDDASTILGLLGLAGIIVALVQVFIRRKLKRKDQHES